MQSRRKMRIWLELIRQLENKEYSEVIHRIKLDEVTGAGGSRGSELAVKLNIIRESTSTCEILNRFMKSPSVFI